MTRGTLVALAAGLLLGGGGTAVAANQGLIWATHAGVTCGFGTGPHGRGVACVQTSQRGYGATVTGTEVLVWKGSRIVFKRQQPR